MLSCRRLPVGVCRHRFFASASSSALRDVVVFEGDGIGPEIVAAARQCVDEALVAAQSASRIRWLERDAGAPGLKNLNEADLAAFDSAKLMFKGPLTIKPGELNFIQLRERKFSSANQVFRKVFELFANVRPLQSYKGVVSPFQLDWVVFRENTEDVYTGEEEVFNAGQANEYVQGVKRNSKIASRRIGERAAHFALASARKRITVLHKANVCKRGDGLWLREASDAARAVLAADPRGAAVVVDDQLADSFLCDAVQRPQDFDVLLCPNLVGDFVSDMGGGLIGSLGLCGSANLGVEHALFEPAHGSAPSIAGQQKANPISMVLAGSLMLRHINEIAAAQRLENAVRTVVADGNVPPDLGGKRSTDECRQAIIDAL